MLRTQFGVKFKFESKLSHPIGSSQVTSVMYISSGISLFELHLSLPAVPAGTFGTEDMHMGTINDIWE
jgi:hypothetical protein